MAAQEAAQRTVPTNRGDSGTRAEGRPYHRLRAEKQERQRVPCQRSHTAKEEGSREEEEAGPHDSRADPEGKANRQESEQEWLT